MPEHLQIINLTDHTVIVGNKNEVKLILSPSGKIARCYMKLENVGVVDGIPLCRIRWEKATNLPPKRKGVMYLVSQIVFDNTDRDDLLAPDTTKRSVIKDGQGNTIAVKRLRVKEGFSIDKILGVKE